MVNPAFHCHGCHGEGLMREDFPILNQSIHGYPLVYLDNAATSQKPRAVLDATRNYYERNNANVHRGIHELSNRATAAYENGRERVASFFNARSSREIIFTRGTTEALNLVAHSWGRANLKAGDIILLTEMEHHSNLVPWQLVARETGAELRFIPVTGDEGLLDLSAIDSLLAAPVKLLGMTHISNSLGTINPVAELCQKARRQGVVTVVDGAQSAGHLPVDLQEIGCDFYAFSGHKICGPTGIGGLYARAEIMEQMAPYHGGGEMIQDVEFTHSTYKEPPHKFEAGTPNIAGVVGLHAAMDYLDCIGREKVFCHDQELALYAYELLTRLKGVRLFGPQKGRAGLVSFHLNEIHAHDMVTLADQKGVALRGGHHCNQPLMKKLGVDSTSRASFYFYNSFAEVDRLAEVIREIQKFFGCAAA